MPTAAGAEEGINQAGEVAGGEAEHRRGCGERALHEEDPEVPEPVPWQVARSSSFHMSAVCEGSGSCREAGGCAGGDPPVVVP